MNDLEFLEDLKDYIERSEEQIESEWGEMRSAEKLIADGDMPDVYAEVLRRIEAAKKDLPNE